MEHTEEQKEQLKTGRNKYSKVFNVYYFTAIVVFIVLCISLIWSGNNVPLWIGMFAAGMLTIVGIAYLISNVCVKLDEIIELLKK